MSLFVDLSLVPEDDALEIIYRYTPEEIWKTQTSHGIRRMWRDMGLRFANAGFSAVRQRVLSEIGFENDIGNLQDDQIVPARWQLRPVGWQPPTQRQYRFRAVVRDPDLDEEFELFFAINTDQNLTKGEALSMMLERLAADPSRYEFNIEDIELVRVYRGERIRAARLQF